MKISYDVEADVMYLYLNDGSDTPVADSLGVGGEAEGVTADFDQANRLVGIEIQGASLRFGPEGARNVIVDLLGNGGRQAA
ncbi:MAG TPA: DUF2283 domain-containing protein [Chloroflexota bacterium]